MSAADLLAVLIGRHLRYDWDNPRSDANDHLIFSKGHASPLLYSIYKAVGVVSDEELMTGYRRFGSRLEGHPTPVLPWVDVATGSLGQGLPDGVGVALAGKYLDRLPYRVWVLCGDSEMAEGSIWEAIDKASYYQLSNLIAIAELGGERHLTIRGPRPSPAPEPPAAAATGGAGAAGPTATYSIGDQVATRKAYGDALVDLGAENPRVVALDGEVSNSTHADEFAKAYPGRYFEMFIAEQQLVAAAVGLSVRHYVPFASTFAASSPVPTTSSGWRPSRRRTSGSRAPTRVRRSAPTARPRWRWKTWP